jgi:hypothetical protein
MWPNLAKSLFEMIATLANITKLEKVTLVVVGAGSLWS